MYLERLTIATEKPYSPPGKDNPYKATLEVGYSSSNNKMKVVLSEEACQRILMLAGKEIADAAAVQIDDFVRKALAINTQPMLEGKAE